MDFHSDPRVVYKYTENGHRFSCDRIPAFKDSQDVWHEFEDVPLVDASYSGIHVHDSAIRSFPIQFFRVTVDLAAIPAGFAPKSAIAGAVSFKIRWAGLGASDHPGRWDSNSDGGYQRQWLFSRAKMDGKVGFRSGAVVEAAALHHDDGSIDLWYRVDGEPIRSKELETRGCFGVPPWRSRQRPLLGPVFQIPSGKVLSEGFLMPAFAGGINFGTWTATFEHDVSEDLKKDVRSHRQSGQSARSISIHPVDSTRDQMPSLGTPECEANVQASSSSSDRPPSKRARITTAAAPNEHLVAGLQSLMVDLNLADHLPAAIAWCTEQGVESVCELKEVGMEEEFVERLSLQPARAKLMLKRIAESASELQILGIRFDGGETLVREENDWEYLREKITCMVQVKEELPCSLPGHIELLDNFSQCVHCIQDSIAARFRRGNTLESLIQDLESGRVNPMAAEFLVIRVGKAEFQDAPPRYYTFDHRRLFCMWKALVPRIRVRVIMEGEIFNEFAKKSDGLGHKLSELHRRKLHHF